MITIKIKSLIGPEQKFKIETMKDIEEQLVPLFPNLERLVGRLTNVHAAAAVIERYLSNHHMHVEVNDPEQKEDIIPQEFKANEKPKEVKELADIKKLIDALDDAEEVELPEHLTIHGATHRWDK